MKSEDGALEDARRWGIDLGPEDLVDDPEEAVWRDNVGPLNAFLSVATQWRMSALASGHLVATGLDYSGARSGLKMAGIKVDPDLWAALRVIERGAMAAMNEG